MSAAPIPQTHEYIHSVHIRDVNGTRTSRVPKIFPVLRKKNRWIWTSYPAMMVFCWQCIQN